ncbi:hypothetical protein EDD15DRAFT_2361418 [Pisolithus albus]|nr:hypothetical protein EDD15DRAFT_2361418 [Pisolithus albus]
MSPVICSPPAPNNATNVLEQSNNLLATNGASICQMWATTPVPTTATVAASVMLVAPQYIGHFPWFLVKSPIVNFARSLQPTQTECAFALTWNDQGNTVRFSVGERTFMLSFADLATFWCFKYMVYRRDQVDTTCVHPFGAEMLLDAFIKFRIPAQIPLGIRRGIEEGIIQEGSPEGPRSINQAAELPSKRAPHMPSSVISSVSQGSSPAVTYVNRDNSPPTPVPVQEGPCHMNATVQSTADALPNLTHIQPVADALLSPPTIEDGSLDRDNVVSHKKRKHDVV